MAMLTIAQPDANDCSFSRRASRCSFAFLFWLSHFGGPFSSSCQHANGYFATWIAFLAALNYAYSMLLAPSMSP